MTTCTQENPWETFTSMVCKEISKIEYTNWIKPIDFHSFDAGVLTLIVPNVFVQNYLLENYFQTLSTLLGCSEKKELPIHFMVQETTRQKTKPLTPKKENEKKKKTLLLHDVSLNDLYCFDTFIEGPSNQFIKSAAYGVALKPGKTYNPLFIHGGVGLGKTHLLHSIGHLIHSKRKRTKLECITTESFINDLVYHLRNKSVDKMKRHYRSLDVLLVDDIQFLQNRLNFEEEFCNMFETLINESKQIVITSDKPPGELNLSERMIARMEWGIVGHVGIPDLETRVAILQHKAEQKGLEISADTAFYIAEHIYKNVRQLEGALNRLGAYCRLMDKKPTIDLVDDILGDFFQSPISSRISVERILMSVASMYQVRESDIRGSSRQKEITLARQVAMYLCRDLLSDSLAKIAGYFGGKTHSTLLHACKKITILHEKDETLRRQIALIRQNIES
ncbi:chromosomal replication initiator protein DnaA [Candidatus Aerophobetes bacterium]|uniref:Chromosomal replication initiator protein DnaA n=1 Tax=Aerophobetes bacterium TaxID=2030807 RepID=A0A2A4X568_UNCAE|nr:MAG: chromosomal replication initiator protein DnaA [Candidatus Aerophobetes bacterium]